MTAWKFDDSKVKGMRRYISTYRSAQGCDVSKKINAVCSMAGCAASAATNVGLARRRRRRNLHS